MSNSNHVEQVTVTVTLANGDQHTLNVHRPRPQGDNPRFLAQQMRTAMTDLAARLDGLADLHADQLR